MTPMRLRMEAFAFAMGIIADEADALDLDRLRSMAEELAPEDDPLRHAVLEFATAYPLLTPGSAEMAEAGRRLLHAVEVASVPDVPGAERADIHG